MFSNHDFYHGMKIFFSFHKISKVFLIYQLILAIYNISYGIKSDPLFKGFCWGYLSHKLNREIVFLLYCMILRIRLSNDIFIAKIYIKMF